MLMKAIDSYLALRRTLGFRLRVEGGLLQDFGRFASDRGDTHVRTTTAIEWAAQAPSPEQRDRRLKRVVLFARHVRAEDSHHEIPPAGVFPRQRRKYRAYIYSPDEIREILDAATRLEPRHSLRPHTYFTLFGLLAATGLRVSEALALRFQDVTPAGLVIRKTKFDKSRLVPLHVTTARAIDAYIEKRRKVGGVTDHVFVLLRSQPASYQEVNRVFLQLVRGIGIRPAAGKPGPRIHDLRHTFAVRTLERSPESRDAVGRHMRALTTYLGHSTLAANFWYLQATPQLMKDIADAGEAFFEGVVP